MNQEIKVSVIVAVYGTEPYLKECLDSLIHQSLREIQIICVNDCSPDQSAEILEDYRKKDQRIQVITFEENKGYPFAIQCGIFHAKGEYTYILDGDDWLEETGLEKLYQRASANQLDLLAFDCTIFYESPELMKQYGHFSHDYTRGMNPTATMTGQELLTYFGSKDKHYRNVFLYLTKTSLLHKENITMFSRTGDDVAFTFHVFLVAEKAGYENKAFHHYRLRENSGTTREKNPDYLKILFEVDYVSYQEMLRLFWRLSLDVEKNALIFSEIEKIKASCLGYYRKLNPEQEKMANTILENQKNILFHQPLKNLGGYP